MSKGERQSSRSEPKQRAPRRRLRAWQKGLAALSVVIALAGAALMTYAAVTSEEPVAATSPDGAGGASTPFAGWFAPTDAPSGANADGPERSETDRLIDSAGGAVFRLGFGFFAGFAVAYAVRTFVRMALVAAGIAVLGLVGLQYAGLISVDWERVSGGFDTFGGWLTEQTRGLAGFITGYLPTFGAGLAGAFVGFRRL